MFTCEYKRLTCNREATFVYFEKFQPLTWMFYCSHCIGGLPRTDLMRLSEDWVANARCEPLAVPPAPPPPPEPVPVAREPDDVLMKNLMFFHEMKTGTLLSP